MYDRPHTSFMHNFLYAKPQKQESTANAQMHLLELNWKTMTLVQSITGRKATEQILNKTLK